MKFENSMEGPNSKCLVDTACSTPNSHGVDKLKLTLSTYSTFYCGEMQQDSFDFLLLLMEIINKVLFLILLVKIWPLNKRIIYLLFSFVLENALSATYVDWDSLHLNRQLLLSITSTNDVSVQELVMEDHRQKLPVIRLVPVAKRTLGMLNLSIFYNPLYIL